MTDRQSEKIVSDREFYRAEKDLDLLHVIEEPFVKYKKLEITENEFINYLLIHKTPYLKVVQAIVKDVQLSGYIDIEHSKVKVTPLLHDAIVSFEKVIEDYHNKNCFIISIFEVDSKFNEIISLLKKLLKEKKGEPKK